MKRKEREEISPIAVQAYQQAEQILELKREQPSYRKIEKSEGVSTSSPNTLKSDKVTMTV